jgi:hypothetical protein
VVVLGQRSIFDVTTALIFLGTLGILMKIKKAPEPLVIFAAGALGLALTAGV